MKKNSAPGRRQRLLLGALVVVALALLLSACENPVKTMDEYNQAIAELGPKDVLIATIAGEPVYSYDLEKKAAVDAILDIERTPEELRDQIILEELQLCLAEDRGITVDEAELAELLAAQQAEVAADDKAQEALRQYLEAQGQTEEEYWQEAAEVLRRSAIREQLEQQLYEEYRAKDGNSRKRLSEFRRYFEREVVPQLYEEYDVVVIAQPGAEE